jgi:hypothetical protein
MTTQEQAKKPKHEVTVEVNGKPVEVAKNLTGLQVKEAAIGQGVEIQLDFILVLEAEHHQEPREIADDEEITVDKHSRFTANDGDENS